MNHITDIVKFILESLLHIWPYLVLTIPLAVLVQMTGAAKYIKRVLSLHPFWAIVLATIVGAFSPFCSCGVIPIIATLLISGVPLAPVMSFWIASPSMDPEIIFLSAATIGWKLTWWRLGATLFISLSAGFITQFLYNKKALGDQILRMQKVVTVKSLWQIIKSIKLNNPFRESLNLSAVAIKKNKYEVINCSCESEVVNSNCCSGITKEEKAACDCKTEIQSRKSFIMEVVNESYKATFMVLKFMTLAFFINALIVLYIPKDFISSILGGDNNFTILLASIIGIPVYTSNLTALPLVGGLLTQGMNPAAALAFLIAGPTTTLPAMSAVWGIVNRKVFGLYLSFSLLGALVFGYLAMLFL